MEPARNHPNVTVEESTEPASDRRRVDVEFLFLDRETCTRCAGTESALETALDRIAPLLDDLGVDVVVRPIHVDTADVARRTALEVSPTVRIDRRDVQPNPVTSACSDCGEPGVDCRLWTYRGETHATPPVELLVEALLRAAVARTESADTYRSKEPFRLPEDLETAFAPESIDDDRSECRC